MSQKKTKWLLRQEEKQHKQEIKKEIEEYRKEKEKQRQETLLRQEKAIISNVFKPIINSGDLTMSAVKIFKENKKVNTLKQFIQGIVIEKETDIEKLLTYLEKLGLLIQRLNNRKGIEKWEKYGCDSLAKDIANIGNHYQEIKESALSQRIKHMALENLKKRMQIIFNELKEKYHIED